MLPHGGVNQAIGFRHRARNPTRRGVSRCPRYLHPVPHDAADLLAALAIKGESRTEIASIPAGDHVAVQAASIASLLDGRYEGDLTVGELLAHGDHGIGTLNGLDGEMVIVDGEAWRAGADGTVEPIAAGARTPFAVVTTLREASSTIVAGPLANDDLLVLVDSLLPDGMRNAAVRIDGTFDRVHARSVPKQEPPYRPLAEVAGDMVEWTWRGIEATLVGFRFDAGTDGLEVVGHHLHVIDVDRSRAGHVLGCDLRSGTVSVEPLDELHVELPPGVELIDPGGFEDGGALKSIESE